MRTVSNGYRIDGNSLHLAKYMAEAEIKDLVRWSCLKDEIRIELERISVRVSQASLEDSGVLHFHADHEGPAKARTWVRSIGRTISAREIATLIISDVEAIRREFRLLEK
ncbi:hypothetical protein [Streptomyces sp. NPDC048436]|uniref:hypothetical protein n=1 Tax=Streptomyces sp. NPDC048436 TaxID=3365550 RepID=UPI0037245F89